MKKIQLWKNRNEISAYYALVDDEDYNRVMETIGRGKWYHFAATQPEYAYAVNGSRDKLMHRIVMNAPEGMEVDHIAPGKLSRLDNRKSNLRICTRRENSCNKKLRRDSTSGLKGVYYVRSPGYENFLRNGPTLKKDGTPRKNQPQPLSKPWLAYVGDPDKRNRHIRLGYYATKEEARAARNEYARKLHGEFFRSE